MKHKILLFLSKIFLFIGISSSLVSKIPNNSIKNFWTKIPQKKIIIPVAIGGSTLISIGVTKLLKSKKKSKGDNLDLIERNNSFNKKIPKGPPEKSSKITSENPSFSSDNSNDGFKNSKITNITNINITHFNNTEASPQKYNNIQEKPIEPIQKAHYISPLVDNHSKSPVNEYKAPSENLDEDQSGNTGRKIVGSSVNEYSAPSENFDEDQSGNTGRKIVKSLVNKYPAPSENLDEDQSGNTGRKIVKSLVNKYPAPSENLDEDQSGNTGRKIVKSLVNKYPAPSENLDEDQSGNNKQKRGNNILKSKSSTKTKFSVVVPTQTSRNNQINLRGNVDPSVVPLNQSISLKNTNVINLHQNQQNAIPHNLIALKNTVIINKKEVEEEIKVIINTINCYHPIGFNSDSEYANYHGILDYYSRQPIDFSLDISSNFRRKYLAISPDYTEFRTNTPDLIQFPILITFPNAQMEKLLFCDEQGNPILIENNQPVINYPSEYFSHKFHKLTIHSEDNILNDINIHKEKVRQFITVLDNIIDIKGNDYFSFNKNLYILKQNQEKNIDII